MKHETMKILFVIKKSSLLKNGETPIVVRVTINGVSDEVRIQRSVLPKMWNQAKGCCKGRDRGSIELNDYIESLRTKIHNLHKELLLEDALITPAYLLKRLFNKGEKRTFLNTMEKEIKAMEALIGIEYEKITINRYWNCFRCVKQCVSEFYDKEDIVFPELSRDFIIYYCCPIKILKPRWPKSYSFFKRIFFSHFLCRQKVGKELAAGTLS